MIICPVTVVIPTFNRLARLKHSLASVSDQTVSPLEVIVVDDGSVDGTSEWIKEKMPNVTLIQQRNAGVSAARNAGIEKADTEWIAFLDSDDEWLPDKLETQMDALHKMPSFRVCHTEEVWIFDGKVRAVAKPYAKQSGWIFKQCLALCAISPSTVLIHKSVFEEVGVFDESLPACEDYDLWLRICSRMEVLLVRKPLIKKHGGHKDQLSDQRGLDRWRIHALKKLLNEGHLEPEQIELTKNRYREKCGIYAKGLEKHGRHREAESYRKELPD